MFRGLHEGLNRFSTRHTLFVLLGMLGLVMASVQLTNLPWSLGPIQGASGGIKILDMRLHWDANQAYRVLDALGPVGRKLYLRFLWTSDLLLPALMTLLLGVMLTSGLRAATPTGSWLRRLNLLPLLALLADYAENTGITMLLVGYPERQTAVADVTGYVTTFKYILYLGLLALAGMLSAAALIRHSRRKFRASLALWRKSNA